VKIKSTIMVAALLAGSAWVAGAQAPVEPDAVLKAADAAYRVGGPDAFVRQLLEHGPMQGNPDAMAQANMLRSVESYYGTHRSCEIVRTVQAASQTRFVYVVCNYERGPLFAALTFYRPDKKWQVVMFKFHTEAALVWPEALLAQ